MVDDNNIIGVIFALSILLQSGPLVQFLNAEIREYLSGTTIDSWYILALKGGFDKLGFVDLFAALPMLLLLFQPSKSSILTRKKLVHLLSPNFSPLGSKMKYIVKQQQEESHPLPWKAYNNLSHAVTMNQSWVLHESYYNLYTSAYF